jgi:hypothetical protein
MIGRFFGFGFPGDRLWFRSPDERARPAKRITFSLMCTAYVLDRGSTALKSFRFIHTGDIHLDSPLKGLSGHQGAAAERIRSATRAAFDNLVSQAIEERVAFVIWRSL